MPTQIPNGLARADLFVGKVSQDNFVASVGIPPFLTPPQVIRWGVRTFVRDDGNMGADPIPAYVEAFAVEALHEL